MAKLIESNAFPARLGVVFDDLRLRGLLQDIELYREYIDVYSDIYKPCVVEFDSWEGLSIIIETSSWKTKQTDCDDYSSYFPHSQMVLWHKLFEKRFPQLTLPQYTEDERIAARKILNIQR